MTLRLDRTKPFSECRGERSPDDPHYKVAFMQGTKVNGVLVQLPFDGRDNLVPDDGKTEPWEGTTVDSKGAVTRFTHHPLYTQIMRDLVAHKLKKQSEAKPTMGPDERPFEVEEPESTGANVDLRAWLRGEVEYDWQLLVKAGKDQFGRQFTSKKQMVEDLVIDEKIVTEEAVASTFAKFLPPRAA